MKMAKRKCDSTLVALALAATLPVASCAILSSATASEHFQRGAFFFEVGEPLRAAVCLRRSLNLDPSADTLGAFHEVGALL